MRKFAHIISPVKVGRESDLFLAQPITFETMRRAKEVAQGKVDVTLLATCYAKDWEIVPDYFTRARELDRSVLDIASFRITRKLPLFKDVLDRLYEATDAEYLVYSNADIALMPHFYVTVNRLIDQGYDAFAISRRTIPSHLNRLGDLPRIYAYKGKPHSGHDCFVFRRDSYPHYILAQTCLGMPGAEFSLFCNLLTHARAFCESNDHLTFHIGNNLSWRHWKYRDYWQFNGMATAASLETLFRNTMENGIPWWQSVLLRMGLVTNRVFLPSWRRLQHAELRTPNDGLIQKQRTSLRMKKSVE